MKGFSFSSNERKYLGRSVEDEDDKSELIFSKRTLYIFIFGILYRTSRDLVEDIVAFKYKM